MGGFPLTGLKRKVQVGVLTAWFIGFLLSGGFPASAASEEPPEGAKAFAEQFFRQLVEEIVFTDRPGDWGFGDDRGDITFGELQPVYSLNADFALGKSEKLLADGRPKWVAVIFQDGRPVNAIGTRQNEAGQFGLDALGYPPELPHGLLHVKEGEIVLHVPPADEYYVYSETAGTLAKIGLADGTYSPGSPQTVEQFRNMLMERYGKADDRGRRIAVEYAVFGAAIMFVLFGGTWIYFGRRTKTIR
jgi:hypothetical protein